MNNHLHTGSKSVNKLSKEFKQTNKFRMIKLKVKQLLAEIEPFDKEEFMKPNL